MMRPTTCCARRRGLARLGAAACAAACAAAAAPTAVNTSGVFTIWTTLNSSCEKRDGIVDLPDTPARGFVDDLGRTVLVAVDSTSRLSFGPSILNTTRDCRIVWNSTASPDPSLYSTNDGFLDATHSFGNGTVVALLHDEYPGMNYHNCNATPPTWPYCWMVSVSLAISNDFGRTWAHASPPPSNLVAALPYPYESSHTIFGWGDTGGITPHPTDGFYYVAMNNRMTKGLQSNGTCVMRSNALLDPRSWRGWGGDARGFAVPFVSAYTMPPGTEAEHICTVLDPFIGSPCTVLGTTFSTYLNRFVATMGCWADAQPGQGSPSFYWATSADFAHWEDVRVIYTPPPMAHTQFFLYPALLDPDAPSRGDQNYMTIGQNAVLTFVQVTNNFYARTIDYPSVSDSAPQPLIHSPLATRSP